MVRKSTTVATIIVIGIVAATMDGTVGIIVVAIIAVRIIAHTAHTIIAHTMIPTTAIRIIIVAETGFTLNST
jgi:hypothetical protein